MNFLQASGRRCRAWRQASWCRGWKLAEDETRRAEEHQRRRKRAQLEHQRRHTAGRLLFWLYKGVTKPPPNGELAEAMEAYQAAERAQKELEREILAEAETGGEL